MSTFARRSQHSPGLFAQTQTNFSLKKPFITECKNNVAQYTKNPSQGSLVKIFSFLMPKFSPTQPKWFTQTQTPYKQQLEGAKSMLITLNTRLNQMKKNPELAKQIPPLQDALAELLESIGNQINSATATQAHAATPI